MSELDNSSTAQSSGIESPLDAEALILLVGGGLYAAVCMPAIGQRGYPPIDPVWTAMPFLWFAPLLLSALFDSRSIKARAQAITIYAVATALVDAATIVMIVPHQPNPLEVAVNFIFFGPYHLAVAFGLVSIVSGVRRLSCRVLGSRPVVSALFKWSFATLLIAATLAAPFLWRVARYALAAQSGRKKADQAWLAQRAKLYRDDFDERRADEVLVRSEFDQETGLPIYRHTSYFGFGEAYNRRIAELLAEHGIPKWSMKDSLVRDEDLVAMLDSDQMEEIKEFPHDIGENIVIFRRGTVERWGGAMSSSDDGLSIGTKRSGLLGIGSAAEPVSVGLHPNYPRVVFIRNGRTWVGAFHLDGWKLADASRF